MINQGMYMLSKARRISTKRAFKLSERIVVAPSVKKIYSIGVKEKTIEQPNEADFCGVEVK